MSLILYRGCTLYPQFVFPMSPEVASLLNTSFGEWLGIHYEAFTKTPYMQVLVPTFLVPQKTQLPSPLHHTSPNTTKRATPTPHIVHLINQPRPEPYSIVVVLFSWVVLHVPIKQNILVNKA